MAAHSTEQSISSKEDFNHDSEKQQYKAISPEEQDILDSQLNLFSVKSSYWMLFRYATKFELSIILISSLFAIGAGTIFPLMTIIFGRLTGTFSSFLNGTGDVSSFRHETSKLALDFVYLGIASFVGAYVATVGFIYTGECITQKLREQYLSAILRQNIAFFDTLGAGEITTRITADMAVIQEGISEKVGLTLTGLATFVSALVVGFIKDWKLTLIMMSAVFGLVFTMGSLGKVIVTFNKKSQEFSGAGATIAEEVFSSIRNATALGTQDRLAKEYDGYLLKAETWAFKMRSTTGIMIGAVMSIIFDIYALAFWQGSRYLVSGEININHVITILFSIMVGSVSLGQVAPHIGAITGAISTGGPIFSVIDRPSLDKSDSGITLEKVEGTIELKGVKHIYPSRPEVVVMHNFDLVIPAGKVTALVGASGSGKSTIIGLIERFYRPVGGQILLDGHEIQGLDLKWLRRQMALVSQEPVLFGTSIYANIADGVIGTEFEDATHTEKMNLVINAAKMANAHDFISSLPEGYETNVGERGFLMSGGQKQRIAIARAIISDPKILLLDEATSALDTKSEGVVQAALDTASKGRTTIIIAHRLSTIKGADNIVVVSEGTIVEQGTHQELVDRGGAYLQLLEAQQILSQKVTSKEDSLEPDDQKDRVHDTLLPSASHSTQDRRDILGHTLTKQSTYGSQVEGLESRINYSYWTLIKYIWSFNKAETGIMIFGLFFCILGGSATPIQGILMGKEVAALSLPPRQYPKLRHDANFLSLMFFVVGIGVLISYTAHGIAFAYCSERLIFRARSKAIRSLLRQEISFFDLTENSPGALVSMLSTDVIQLAGISGATLGAILTAITTIFFAFILAVAINWKLGLVCATAMPFLLSCGFLRIWMIAQFQIRSRKGHQESASFACEATAAIRTIASLTREDDVMKTYHGKLASQSSKNMRSTFKSSILYGASQSGMYLAFALGFWYGGTLIADSKIGIEDFFICFVSVVYGAQSAGGIFSYAPDMGKSKEAASSLKTLFDRVPEIDVWSTAGEKVDNVQGAVEFRNVHFSYPTRKTQRVLKGIDLKFEPGQNVALVGPSGCGKSTIISLLERFYDPSRGNVFLDGKDISTLKLSDYRSKIALVSQEPVLYSGTIRDNITMGIKEDDVDSAGDDAIVQACKDANIWNFITSLPDGLSTLVGSKAVMLSGGQKQRIAIARALIRDPKILLLDEATSALDSTSEKAVQEALDKASKGRTTISVAHRLSTIQNADCIYYIESGRVVESGSHAELMEMKGKYWESVRAQGLGVGQKAD